MMKHFLRRIGGWGPLLCVFLPFVVLGAEEPLELSVGAEVDPAVGLEWPAPGGGTAHLQIIDKTFHLLFLDDEHKIVEPPVDTAMIRGEETRNKTNNLVRQLKKGSGPFLSHPRLEYPPYDYWLWIILPDASGKENHEQVLPRRRFRQ